MFTEITTIVLGAGGSMPYGYPSGYRLVTDITTLVSINERKPKVADTHFAEELTAAGIHWDVAIEFVTRLYEAFPPSIDYFLFHNPEFMNVGKLAIALCIIRHENRRHLFAREGDGRWYHKLVDRIADPKTGDITKSLSIVTFNYDRSLACFLHAALKSRFRLSDEEAAQRLSIIPIVHVYGHVGLLPWQQKSTPEDPVREYGYTNHANELRIAARGIRTIGAAGDDSKDKARNLLASSKQIYIWGFGFQDDNCELIGLGTPTVSGQVVITRRGLSRALLRLKQKRYRLMWEDDTAGDDHPWDVSSFIDQSSRFLDVAGA